LPLMVSEIAMNPSSESVVRPEGAVDGDGRSRCAPRAPAGRLSGKAVGLKAAWRDRIPAAQTGQQRDPLLTREAEARQG
jgi:hypothetical protein